MIKSFKDLITNASNKFGDQNYIVSANKLFKNYSFRDLNKFRINMNQFLRNNSVNKNDKVLVVMHNSNILTLLFLTIIANSRIFVPVNPKSSIKEIDYIINQTNPKLIIGFSWYKKKIKNKSLKSIFINNENFFINKIYKINAKEKLNKKNKNNKNQVSQILFTSGSTGLPKGVVLTQNSMLTNLEGIRERLNIKQHKPRFLAVTPLFHNNGQFIPTMLPLLLGGTTTPIESETSIVTFWNAALENKINYSSVMATHIAYFVKHFKKPKNCNLKCLFCGGAKLEESVKKKFEKKFKIKVATNYGLTETSSIVATENMYKDNRKKYSVGKPLFNNAVKILKKNKNEKYGEILIKGNNLFNNYLNKNELFKSRFKAKWFKTGDLGYLDRENYLYINDRIDNMIIVSGENIYPSEVEKHLDIFKEIDIGILTSIPDEITQNKLVLVYESKKLIDIRKFQLKMQNYVSSFKIPKYIVNCKEIGLNEIPKAPNKKILRGKLRNFLIKKNNLFKKF